jgi:hypothetical protein
MICEWCKTEFVKNRVNQRFCRKQCAKYASRKRTGRKNKEKRRYRWMKLGINITFNEYRNLLQQQNGKCKICQKHFSEIQNRALQVDHNHNDGKIRGLLCGACNMGLGNFRDDYKLLRKAIEYLRH